MNSLLHRLPRLREVIPVYAVIAFIVYAWAIFIFLWNFTSWLYYLYLNEILAIFAYRMVASLGESLLVLGAILLVCFMLPSRFLRDAFVIRGTSTAICMLGPVVLFWYHFFPGDVYFWMIVPILLAILVGFLSTRVRMLSSFLRWLADSTIVFLYIFMPVAAISLVTVLIRNIF